MTTIRFLALLAVMSVLPMVCARREQVSKEVKAHKHQTVEVSVQDMRAWAKRHHNKKYDARCAKHCVPADDDESTACKPSTGAHWKDFCTQWCDQKTVKGLCITPEDKEAGVEKVSDPTPPPKVEERQNDAGNRHDDSDEDELEEEEEKKGGGCFPADASVKTRSGPKKMSELRVGDAVQAVNGAGQMFFDEVYFFGHADASVKLDYVSLQLEAASLELSHRHFIPTCPERGAPCDWTQHVHAYAQDVQPGDYVWAASGNGMALHIVLAASTNPKQGQFNPYTLSGNIVVNGVVVSAHSDWVLDSLIPSSCTHYLPKVYQALFLPGRWLYHVAGSDAADMLDVNNPQLAPSKHGYGPEFLSAFAGLFLALAFAIPYKYVK